MTTTDLAQCLAPPHPESLGHPDLATIRRQGGRRRRARRTAVLVGSSLAVASVAGIGLGIAGPGSDDAAGGDRNVTVQSPPEAPKELSALAKRVLREIPGAVQVSPGQVVIPGPGTGHQWDEVMQAGDFAEGPVSLDAHTYLGVTAYPRSGFPAWLYDEVQRIEKEELGSEENGYPVGSTEMGILVDSGDAQLGCMARQLGSEVPVAGACYPALIASVGGKHYYRWGMGTDDFLEPGQEMELFTSDDYSSGSPSTVWIGGLDGTDVTRVVFDLADGTSMEATVATGTFVPGDTMFWANVPGELMQVRAYDASGKLVDDHEIKPCSGGVDCEVR